MKKLLIFLIIIFISVCSVFFYFYINDKGIIEIIDDSNNVNVTILGVYKNNTYVTTGIVPVYNKGNSKEPIVNALRSGDLTLKEILNQMENDSKYHNIYKYNGNKKLGKDKFIIKVCDNFILFLPYNISNSEFNC